MSIVAVLGLYSMWSGNHHQYYETRKVGQSASSNEGSCPPTNESDCKGTDEHNDASQKVRQQVLMVLGTPLFMATLFSVTATCFVVAGIQVWES